MTGNLNLDDFMVFESDQARAVDFFTRLFNGHAASLDVEPDRKTWKPGRFIAEAFTETRAFQELVRAAEGVPRDAINVASKAAQLAGDTKIGVNHVRRAARDWYQQEKLKAVESIPGVPELLAWIIDEVIGSRRTKAFLVSQDQDDTLAIKRLFDARLVHLVRRGYSAQDRAGERYNVYMLDYGAYVDLIQTQRMPVGALIDDEGQSIDVPNLDLRSARRAVLDLTQAPGR